MNWSGARWKPSPTWRSRILIGLGLGAVGYVAAVLLKFGPAPLPYIVMVAIVLTLAWLVLDTADAPPAEWRPTLAPAGDRVDEATSDLRILSSHLRAREPSHAVRTRLIDLARFRDPDLATALTQELGHEHDPVRRLSPREIDRILTRIETST